jgi:hypothetical protein
MGIRAAQVHKRVHWSRGRRRVSKRRIRQFRRRSNRRALYPSPTRPMRGSNLLGLSYWSSADCSEDGKKKV